MKAIIFDIGRVLVDFDWDIFMRKLFRDDQKTIDAVTEAIWGDRRWVEFDRGILTDEEVIESFLTHGSGYEKEIRLTVERVGEVLVKRNTAIPWIKDLKSRGYQVFFLSNYSEFLRKSNPDVLDFLPLMDGGIWSDKVHLLKPDPEIYRCLLNKYHCSPEECVFIDDTEANVRGAEAVGIKAIQYTTYEETRRALEDLLDASMGQEQ